MADAGDRVSFFAIVIVLGNCKIPYFSRDFHFNTLEQSDGKRYLINNETPEMPEISNSRPSD